LKAGLSFEQAPPFSVPLRFFLTAPLFGIAAGLLLIFSADGALTSRWQPTTLALTHLLVAGFLLQIMAGALFQFVPVVTGGNVRWPRLTAHLIHPALTLGTVLLVCGFLRASPTLFVSAASVLGAGLFGLVAVIGLALIGSEGKGETKTALRVAVLALLVTAALGASLSMALGGYMAINPLPLLEAHLAWGLGGWALLLLAGVSWAVVPMFQITPPYPKALTRPFPWLMVGALALLSLGLMSSSTVAIIIGKGLLVLAAASFAASTLRLQALRKRKTSDTTLSYFRVAMTALLAACLLGLALLLVPSLADQAPWPLELGVLLIVGVLTSAVCGMLYKIVPFLVWLHLRSVAPRGVLPPTMNRMISTKRMNWQMGAHLLALALLLALPWLPQLTTLAGLALATSCAGLLANLLVALRIYRDFKSQNPVAA
jgi:hypothetical protein